MDFRAGKSAAKLSGARSDLSADRLRRDDFVNGSHFLDELFVLIDCQCLRTIRQRLLRWVVDFADQSISPARDSGPRPPNHHLILPPPLRTLAAARHTPA